MRPVGAVRPLCAGLLAPPRGRLLPCFPALPPFGEPASWRCPGGRAFVLLAFQGLGLGGSSESGSTGGGGGGLRQPAARLSVPAGTAEVQQRRRLGRGGEPGEGVVQDEAGGAARAASLTHATIARPRAVGRRGAGADAPLGAAPSFTAGDTTCSGAPACPGLPLPFRLPLWARQAPEVTGPPRRMRTFEWAVYALLPEALTRRSALEGVGRMEFRPLWPRASIA